MSASSTNFNGYVSYKPGAVAEGFLRNFVLGIS